MFPELTLRCVNSMTRRNVIETAPQFCADGTGAGRRQLDMSSLIDDMAALRRTVAALLQRGHG